MFATTSEYKGVLKKAEELVNLRKKYFLNEHNMIKINLDNKEIYKYVDQILCCLEDLNKMDERLTQLIDSLKVNSNKRSDYENQQERVQQRSKELKDICKKISRP